MLNLLRDLPDASAAEVFISLLERPGCRIERIVSQGQTTPVVLEPGSTLFIPADTEHWVTYTDPAVATVWLAIHLGAVDAAPAPA